MCDGGKIGEMPILSSNRALPGRVWTSAPCTVLGKTSESAVHHLLETQGIAVSQQEEHWKDKLLRDWARVTLQVCRWYPELVSLGGSRRGRVSGMIQGRKVWRARARSPTVTAQLRDEVNLQGGLLSRSVIGNPTLVCCTAWDIPGWQTSTKMPVTCLLCLHSIAVLSATCAEAAGQHGRIWIAPPASLSPSMHAALASSRLPLGEWDTVRGLSDLPYCTQDLPSWTTMMHSHFTPTRRAGAVPTPTSL